MTHKTLESFIVKVEVMLVADDFKKKKNSSKISITTIKRKCLLQTLKLIQSIQKSKKNCENSSLKLSSIGHLTPMFLCMTNP